jgi:alkylation response protein AidB-like acyl-CoA dehydrogenase
MLSNLSPEEEQFRQEVRYWLADNLPAGWTTLSREPTDPTERAEFRLDWERRLASGGWGAVHWPKEYGGRDASLVEQAIFLEECALANTPEGLNIVGRNIIGPTIMKHGTPEQRARFLPRIVAGEEVWCQGFSEPEAGSDLASVRTRAEKEGDDFVLNGQKVWTSFAQYAQWIFVLARTDANVPKHKGLTFFLLDMQTPGITVRPLVQITGESEFNEVFFDNVKVPAGNILGSLNSGWSVAMTTLFYERGPIEAMARQVRFRRHFQRILDIACAPRPGGSAMDDGAIRQDIALLFTEIELMRVNCLRGFAKLRKGEPLGTESAFTKLYWSEMYQRLTELALRVQGDSAPAGFFAQERIDTSFQQLFLSSRSATIASGSSEIQRNIIAERVLGLPR